MLVVDDIFDLRVDLIDCLYGVNVVQDSLFSIKVTEGVGLSVISNESLADDILLVVASLDERLARHVVLHGDLGRVEDLVVGASALRVDQAPTDSFHHGFIVDFEFDDAIELGMLFD